MTHSEARRHAAEGTPVCSEVIMTGTRPTTMTVRGTLTREERGDGGRSLFTVTPSEPVPPGTPERIRRPALELWSIETDEKQSREARSRRNGGGTR